MKQYVIILSLILGANLFGQVGIGTITPNAQLDVVSSSQTAASPTDGILIPKVNEFPTTNPGASQDGMLVYATGSGSVTEGFYYWNHGATRWTNMLTDYNSAGWYEEIISTPPDAITDDIFTFGRVAIGKNFSDYILELNDANPLTTRTLNITSINATSGTSFSVYNESTFSGTGDLHHMYNLIGGSATGSIIGLHNFIQNSGDGIHTGTTNDLSDGNGAHYGTQNRLGGLGSGFQFGVYNAISNRGDGFHYGTFNNLYGIGLGDHYGNRNSLSGSGTGTHYGTYNALSASGAGDKYGSYNLIHSTLAGGTHYGVYSDVQKTGSYAGFFIGDVLVDNDTFFVDASTNNVGIGNTSPAYKLEVSGAIMLENGGAPATLTGHSGLYSRSGELTAVDDSGNQTTISPHHFELTEPSDPMAWSFYSRNKSLNSQINVDMLKVVKLVEKLSGEQLVYKADLDGNNLNIDSTQESLAGEVAEIKKQNELLLEVIEKLQEEIDEIKSFITKKQ